MSFLLILLYLLNGKPVFEQYMFRTEEKCAEVGTAMIEAIDNANEVEWVTAGCLQVPGQAT